MANEISEALRVLTSIERLEVLEKIVKTMSKQECDFVSTTIAQKNDPLFVLPIELILVLSSDDLLRSVISRWHTEGVSDHGRLEGFCESIQSRIIHMQAMRLGSPLSEKVINDTGTGLQGPQPRLSPRRLDFKGRRVAYISSHQGQGDAVTVHDLVIGDKMVLRGEARERVILVVLTINLVAFVTFDGYLYVRQFGDNDASDDIVRIKLPSASIRAAGGDGHFVAIAMGPPSGSSWWYGPVVLYNADNNSMRRIAVEKSSWHPPRELHLLQSHGILIDSEAGYIDVFSIMCEIDPTGQPERNKHLRIGRYRTSFDGESPQWDHWKFPLDFQTSIRDYQYLLAPPCPIGKGKQQRIAIYEVPFMGGLPFRLKSSVIFDPSRNAFVPDEYEAATTTRMKTEQKNTNALWKDQLYRPSTVADWFEYVFYMNDTFMVSLEVSKLRTSKSRIRVLCFDPDVHMTGAEDTRYLQELKRKFNSGLTFNGDA